MDIEQQSKNIHLMWRAGFGPRAGDLQSVSRLSSKELFASMLKASSKTPEYIRVSTNTLDGLWKGIVNEGRMQELSKEQKQQIRKDSREALKNLNIRWLDEMVHSDAQLREKMAFFWHGHFANREINIFFQQKLLDILRRNALGNFGNLLVEVSKSAAMLAFLNNQQNRKQSPNENFAREVMELFTLGRGNYTEKDIKEAARAFTGWGFDLGGEFVFRKQFHDTGTKTIFGKTGNFDGDDVISMLLENRQTANYITAKIFRFFVNDDPDTAIISTLSNNFYQSGYDIKKLMSDIFQSPWFYKPNNTGVKIKSPVELLVGIRRILPMDFEREEVQLLYQRLLGQILFYPPNVAGWPGGRNWIDSSSLMYRLHLPRLLHDDQEFSATPKDDDDVMMGQGTASKSLQRGRINVKVDWQAYTSVFKDIPRNDLPVSIAASLLQGGKVDLDLLNKYADAGDRESYIRSVTINLMSTPDYQLM